MSVRVHRSALPSGGLVPHPANPAGPPYRTAAAIHKSPETPRRTAFESPPIYALLTVPSICGILCAMYSRSVIALLTVLIFPAVAHSEIKTLTVTHTYVMGDNDSPNDARHMCFLEAKRQVLERAGAYIESVSEVKNFQLTKDKITSFSAAILRVEIVKEKFAFENGHNTLALTVQSAVDTADVQKRLAAIVSDPGMQDRITGQQQQITQLEQQVQALNSRLSVAPVTASGTLRKERTVVFGDIEELEKKKLAAVKAMTGRTQIIRQYILLGMTRDEVRGIVGEPRASMYGQSGAPQGKTWVWSFFYGELWICFTDLFLVGAVGENEHCS